MRVHPLSLLLTFLIVLASMAMIASEAIAQETPEETSTSYPTHAWDSVERVQDSILNVAYLALTIDSTRVEEFVKISDVYKARKQRSLQLQNGRRMVSAIPTSAMSYLIYGDAQFDNDLPDSAIISLKQAVTISPGFVRAHTILAEAYAVLKQNDSALMHLDSAIAYNPRYAQARVQRSTLLTKLGRDFEAVEDYRVASELLPTQFVAWYKFGTALAKVNQYDEAAEVLNYATTLNPRSADALFQLAEVNQKRGHTEDALSTYTRFYLTFPTDSRALEAERRARSLATPNEEMGEKK